VIAQILQEAGGRGIGVVIGMILGGAFTWGFALWKRRQERLSILAGDARDTIVIHQHIVEVGEVLGPDGEEMVPAPASLRIRAVGQAEVNRVVPNGHLASVLLRRARRVEPVDTLISMEGAEGSYLLETLTNFVCDRIANGPFAHDLYVMAPCCEPAELAEHQPITILLVRAADLPLFERWPSCRDVRVEHGSDGARLLTLMEMARRFRREQEKIAVLRKAGERTQHVETMYVLDLALDGRAAPVPTKPVPWGRFEAILGRMNLE
jgi:hypothetical protein